MDGDLTFVDSKGVRWTAPVGTLTDGASVPRLALPITDGRFGTKFLKAAVVHDAYCQLENQDRCPDQYRTRPWRDVHRMFFEACLAGGTDPLLAKTMFAAVWLAGPRWGDPAPGQQEAPDELLTNAFAASREWIEKEEPSVEEIVADLNRRESLLLALHEQEAGVMEALGRRDQALARELLGDQERLLRRELERSPDDLMLLNFMGYVHKNLAIVHQRSGQPGRVAEELDESERLFQRVLESEPRDPSALNGLGSVAFGRGDLDQAEAYILQALEIMPSYPAAQHDLRLIERLRGARQPDSSRRLEPVDRGVREPAGPATP